MSTWQHDDHHAVHCDKCQLFYPFRGLAKIVQKQTVFALHAFRELIFLRKYFCQQNIAVSSHYHDRDPLMLIISVISIVTSGSVKVRNRFLMCQGHSPPFLQSQMHLCFEPRTIFKGVRSRRKLHAFHARNLFFTKKNAKQQR